MIPISDYTFDFNKYPTYPEVTKKYFIEWIEFGIDNEKYVVDTKDFDSFEEARKYNTASHENGIGWLYRNRRFTCPIK